MKLKHRFRHYLLSFDNSKDKTSKKELDKIDMYVDQIFVLCKMRKSGERLFCQTSHFRRCRTRCVTEISYVFIKKKIMIETDALDVTVYTDAKWLLFILFKLFKIR